MTQSISDNITGIIIKLHTNEYIKYITFWKNKSEPYWEVEYFASNTSNHICEKCGIFQECNKCIYYDPKYDCNFTMYKIPQEIVEITVSRALQYNNCNDTVIWYTLENPNLIRYWEIDTILQYAQPFVP